MNRTSINTVERQTLSRRVFNPHNSVSRSHCCSSEGIRKEEGQHGLQLQWYWINCRHKLQMVTKTPLSTVLILILSGLSYLTQAQMSLQLKLWIQAPLTHLWDQMQFPHFKGSVVSRSVVLDSLRPWTAAHQGFQARILDWEKQAQISSVIRKCSQWLLSMENLDTFPNVWEVGKNKMIKTSWLFPLTSSGSSLY